MSIRTHLVRSAAIAATIGALVAGAAAFALPAAADVTGYDTGYQYRQGLATGAGGELMGAAATGAVVTDASADAANATPAQSAVGTQTATPVVDTTAAPSAQPATVNALQPAPAAAAAVPAASIDLGTMVGWGALIVAFLLVVAAIWSYASQSRTETRRTTTTVYR